MRGRIWGTKFQEIYKGCRNKYITLNDNRCKHIPQEPKVKVRYARTQKQVENFQRNANGGFWKKKKEKKKNCLSLYMYKHCLVTQIYLEKLFSWSENECKL